MNRRSSSSVLVLALWLAACGGSAPPSPVSAEPAAAIPTTPEVPAAATAPASSPPAQAAATAAKHADGMVTLRGKSSPIVKMKLTQEGGEFYFYVDDEAGEGVGIRLGADLKVGAKIERDRGVMGHVQENGSPVNVGDSSSFSFEVTKLKLGTWEKPGTCSGKFTAEVKTPNFTIQASGPFTDIECFSM